MGFASYCEDIQNRRDEVCSAISFIEKKDFAKIGDMPSAEKFIVGLMDLKDRILEELQGVLRTLDGVLELLITPEFDALKQIEALEQSREQQRFDQQRLVGKHHTEVAALKARIEGLENHNNILKDENQNLINQWKFESDRREREKKKIVQKQHERKEQDSNSDHPDDHLEQGSFEQTMREEGVRPRKP